LQAFLLLLLLLCFFFFSSSHLFKPILTLFHKNCCGK
jgi:hypothetical protein